MHQITTQNKFLRKVAKANSRVSFFDRVKAASNQAKAGVEDIRDLVALQQATDVDPRDLQAMHRAGEDIQNWQAGKAAPGYNPLKSFETITKVTGNPKFSEGYAKWSKTRAGHKWRPGLDRALKYHNAMAYAQDNPLEFKALQQSRGMTPMNFIFDSADNNYRLMRALNSPLGIFLNDRQRSQARNNFGLMELIWRIKKFFSEFGNWRYQVDPSELYRFNIRRPTQRPSINNTKATNPTVNATGSATRTKKPLFKMPLEGAQGLK